MTIKKIAILGAGPVGLEAAALARPIIASSTGGIPELVNDGEHALLVPPGDAAALAAYWLPGSVRYYNHFVWQALAFLDGRAAITWPVT